MSKPDSVTLVFERLRSVGVFTAALLCMATVAVAQTQSASVTVTLPNGYAHIVQDDLMVESTGGAVRWSRVWDGQEWKFNPHWESLSQSWKNLTGSQTADTTGSTVAGGAAAGTMSLSSSNSNTDNSGCWVWVDEDWEPSVGSVIIGGVPQAGPMAPERITPFNRLMGEDEFNYSPPMRVSVDYASLCVGTQIATGMQDLEGIRRQNELYLGEQGRYSFSNRAILEKRAVQQVADLNAGDIQQLGSGSITLAPTTHARGYRWIHREGDWIDYNTQGQVVAYGDRNDNVVWLVRDQAGALRGVVDAVGQVLFTLHYAGPLLTEVRDYPLPGNSLDLPARSVRYQYDDSNRLTVVTDARGNTIRYGYNGQNRIVSVTDPEGRIERLDYHGDTVSKRTAPDGAVTDYLFEYDDANQQFASKITGPETESGRRVEDHTHNRSGKPVRRIVNGRIEKEVRYDTGARAELHTNARGFVTRITHNEFDQVVRVDHPDGTSQQRSFSALHLQPTEEIDEAGVKTQYQYDAKGNPIKRIRAVGTPVAKTTDVIVNALGQPTSFILRGRSETDGTVTPDSTWLAEYDSKGRYRETTDPEGNVRRYVYNRIGSLVSYTDPRNHETRYEVDAAGHLTRILDAIGRSETYTYDKVGNLTGITDQRGKSTQMAYDAMNRRIQMTSPLSGVYRVQYNGQGLPVQETDEEGRTARAEFDPLRRLTKEVDALGNVIEYSYDIPDGSAAGTVGALEEPTEIRYPTFTERRRFDQRERLTNKILLNPTALGTEGLVDGVTRDKLGRIASVTDANSKTRSYAYDALGQMIETTDSLGAKTMALYDARGNLLRITDVNGNASRFKYNRNSRLLQEILPLGQTTTYTYDGSGNLLTKTDANGNVARYTHDAADRLQKIQRLRGATLVRTTQFGWDNEDNLISWTDIDHTRPSGQQTASGSATYDDAGNKIAETLNYPTPSGATYTLTYSYAYSAAGFKTRLTWPDGTIIDYGYAGQGALESVTIAGEGTISVNQFKWLAPEKITLPGGATQVRTFDGLLNIESLKVRTPSQQSILEFASTYGKVQELKSSSRTDTAGGVSTTSARDFTYDAETRLTQVSSGGSFGTSTESFTLDAIGNRVAHSKVAGAWTYDANNRLLQKGTGAGSTTFEYDDAGNLTRRTEAGGRIARYTYDGQNRLTEVRDGASNLVARYGYDLLDARIWKEQYRDASGNALTQTRRTYYLYSDEGLLAESEQAIILGADGAVTVNIAVNGGLPLITAQYGPRPDEEFTTSTLFVKTLNTNGSAVVAYYHHDELGTPVSATDKSGNIVWAASYDVFGHATIVTPGATVERPTISSNLRLPGQYFDSETGLHYNYRRYYDPTIGRYISQDPIGFEGGDNLYRYAEADPVNQSDPTGECPACYVACVAACMLEDAATNAITGECNNFGDSAKNCALTCAVGMGLGRLWKWGKKLWDRIPCSINSFPADTAVHVKPAGSAASRALFGETEIKPIGRIAVGDEVLAYAEWKEPGNVEGQDVRFSYERVTDVFTSYREQQLVHLTLADGGELTATEGHPFLTPEGWRDALLLKRGGKLLLKASAEDAQGHQWATIQNIRVETKVLSVFNLQVANTHTYFTGVDGVLTHNHGNSKSCKKFQRLYEIFNKPTGKTQKYGVTGTPPNGKGKLPRPQSQLGPNEDYRIKDTANNRKDILDKERQAVDDYRRNNNNRRPPGQRRP